jgi:hypothetical protein
MLNEHFLCEQSKNESFVFKMEADGDDKLTHCFWAGARSRRAYKFYGDAVVFDTTYCCAEASDMSRTQTNAKYKMISQDKQTQYLYWFGYICLRPVWSNSLYNQEGYKRV